MNEPAIDLQDVAKTYPRSVQALRGVRMEVRDGEIFGLLGPNGAGKSTLVKILLTIVKPTRCEGRMLGQPVGDRSTLRRIGYLPEQMRFPDYLTANQVLDFVGGLHEVPGSVRKKRADELLELVGLSVWRSRPLRSYSKGMKQRLGLAQALINKPALVFLDEPTDGLDPISRREVADILRTLRERGVTVFLNSHLLGEAERLCDRVAILSSGQVVRQGTVEELTREGRSYEVRVDGRLAEIPTLWEIVVALGGTISFDSDANETHITLPTTRPQQMMPVIDELRRHGITIDAIVPLRQSLEEYFIKVVSSAPAGKPAATVPPTGSRESAPVTSGPPTASVPTLH